MNKPTEASSATVKEITPEEYLKNGQKEDDDDILFYDLNKNEMEKNSKLNEPSSFVNCFFINFDFNDNVKIETLWNINNKNKIIKFNNKLGKFYCE